ncbi:MAG: hypothetical protein JSS11_07275 [Verrucomicrobia bacterium]|nr:hypothetical protein [Verrucomicrobiota bacterium]
MLTVPRVTPLPYLRCLYPLILLLSALSGRAAPAPDLPTAWNDIADSKAKLALVKLGRADTSDRAVQLARATASLDDQPVSDGDLRRAEATFAQLAQGHDELAEQAAYLQARVWQIHLAQPDYARAAELYRALAERNPRSHWAQLGLVKLALVQLYALPDPADPAARLAGAAALLSRVTEPTLQRDLQLQLGQAGIFYKQPLPSIIAHLVAADRIGGTPGAAGEDLILQIGELSLRAGDYATSRAYFERYLRDYEVNPRCFTVKEKLQQIAAHEAAAKGGRP